MNRITIEIVTYLIAPPKSGQILFGDRQTNIVFYKLFSNVKFLRPQTG